MTGHRRFRRRIYLCAVALALSGCSVGQVYVAPTFPFLARYDAAPQGAPVLLDNAAWWRHLDDPALDRLVALALADNLSLALARERVVASRAALDGVPGAGLLTSSAGVRAEGTGSDGPDPRSTSQLGLTWMLDPWGARREELRAAGARVQVAEAETDAARLLVLYNLTSAHADLRYRQRLLTLARRNLDTGQRLLRQTRARMAAGEATRLDVARAGARVAEIESGLPALQAQISGTINEISVLAGRLPGGLPGDLARALATPAAQARTPMSPDVGIPADLLRNRPDIRIAERGYAAAVAEIGIAEAALYPSLSLTGLISLNGLGSGPHRPDYYFGPAVQFPALPLNSARASVRLRHSQARQAHEAWKATTLTAILEVENALLDYRAVSRALGSGERAERLYRETFRLTEEVLERGEATVADLLDAQQDVSGAERALADLIFRKAQGFIEINVRLGAGHRAAASETVAPGTVAPGTVAQVRTQRAPG